MSSILVAMDALLAVYRVALFIIAVAAVVIFGVDWLVRTRRLNPFSPIARFFRRVIDPVLSPIEVRVVRAGGLPSSAPWWALVAIVLGGLVLLALLEFLRGQLAFAAHAGSAGFRGLLAVVITWTFGILQLALIVRVLSSWVRISEYSRWVRWTIPLTEWLLRPLRNVIPPVAGAIDLSPLVAWIILWLMQRLLLGIL
jgi:YggT family protein